MTSYARDFPQWLINNQPNANAQLDGCNHKNIEMENVTHIKVC